MRFESSVVIAATLAAACGRTPSAGTDLEIARIAVEGCSTADSAAPARGIDFEVNQYLDIADESRQSLEVGVRNLALHTSVRVTKLDYRFECDSNGLAGVPAMDFCAPFSGSFSLNITSDEIPPASLSPIQFRPLSGAILQKLLDSSLLDGTGARLGPTLPLRLTGIFVANSENGEIVRSPEFYENLHLCKGCGASSPSPCAFSPSL